MHAKTRPLAHFTLQIDKPPMLMDDLITDRQTQPAAIRPSGKYSFVLESKPYTGKDLLDNPLLFIVFASF
jgi:hypothetical protein